jgi:hypothetical protein
MSYLNVCVCVCVVVMPDVRGPGYQTEWTQPRALAAAIGTPPPSSSSVPVRSVLPQGPFALEVPAPNLRTVARPLEGYPWGTLDAPSIVGPRSTFPVRSHTHSLVTLFNAYVSAKPSVFGEGAYYSDRRQGPGSPQVSVVRTVPVDGPTYPSPCMIGRGTSGPPPATSGNYLIGTRPSWAN